MGIKSQRLSFQCALGSLDNYDTSPVLPRGRLCLVVKRLLDDEDDDYEDHSLAAQFMFKIYFSKELHHSLTEKNTLCLKQIG